MLRRRGGLAAARPTTARQPSARILWFTERLEPLWPLLRTLHDIQERSEVARGFLARLDELIATLLTNAFHDSVPSRDLGRSVVAFRAAVEGAYASGLDVRERHQVLRFTIGKLTAPGDWR